MLETSLVRLIADTERSVVSIVRVRRDNDRELSPRNQGDGFGRLGRDLDREPHPAFIGNDFGAGIIISDDGLILTNNHLVKGGPIVGNDQPGDSLLVVRFSDRSTSYARIVAADPRCDLAVLRVPASSPHIPLKLYSGAPLKKGQLVVGLGNPYAIGREDGSATAALGMIANTNRSPSPSPDYVREDDENRKPFYNLNTLMTVDMRLNLGTSGGALVNLKGELVGVTTTLAALEGHEKSTGFAVPVDGTTVRWIEALSEGYEVEYGYLGVSLNQILTDAHWAALSKLHLNGAALVGQVQGNTPAALAGLATGDLILAVNNNPIASRSDLLRQVALIAPGGPAELMICRPNEAVQGDHPPPVRTLHFDVWKWPVFDDEGIVATKRRYEPWRGLVVDFSTARDRLLGNRRHFLPPEVQPGVLIVDVLPKSPASRTEPTLQPGDCITRVAGKPVQNPREFYTICREIKGGDVPLTLSNGRKVVLSP